MRFFLLVLLLPLTVFADFRGAWVSSVYNINFPTAEGQSAESQKLQIVRILNTAKQAHLNVILVQVRPESDALYASHLEPWSRFLTGHQGKSPGYDPLAFFIAEARQRGIGVHAWINPFRAAAHASDPRTTNQIANELSQYVYHVGSVLWMDPGAPAVQDHILAVVKDLLEHYDLAGIHYDDYFYPYPTDSGAVFPVPDNATYGAYARKGGTLSKADWRRENINSLIRRTSALVHGVRPGAKFGVSPFGIYEPGVPAGTTAGVNQYGQLYSDPVKWMREGWVDYLAPQLYWRDAGPQSFSKLLAWWRGPEANPREVPIYPGINLEKLASPNWGASEIARQLIYEKAIGPRPKGGVIFWNIKELEDNTRGVMSVIAQ